MVDLKSGSRQSCLLMGHGKIAGHQDWPRKCDQCQGLGSRLGSAGSRSTRTGWGMRSGDGGQEFWKKPAWDHPFPNCSPQLRPLCSFTPGFKSSNKAVRSGSFPSHFLPVSAPRTAPLPEDAGTRLPVSSLVVACDFAVGTYSFWRTLSPSC